jgi:hypothetical protein
MQRMSSLLVVGLVFLFEASHGATQLNLDTEANRSFSAVSLGLDWQPSIDKQADSEKEELEFPLIQLKGFSLSGGGDQQKVEDSTTGEVTTYRSRSGSVGVRFQLGESWFLNLSGSATETPETYYKESGPQGSLQYKINSNFRLGVRSGSALIEQKYSIEILNRIYERSLSLNQNYNGLIFKYTLPEVFSITLSGTQYKYSKSKEELQTAYQNQFLNNFVSEVVSSISGLPESSAAIDVMYFMTEDIDLGLYYQNSVLIVDSSRSQRGELTLTKYFDRISIGAGLGSQKTTSTSSNSVIFNLGFEL